ncbi:MAG: peptide ABC transporter substrate-binding protein [Hungatella sp.]|nr:peptide ABC transporter substrate-binding protein [Hungatella sp.]
MKKTRQTMLILLSAAMMAGALNGCSGSSSKPEESIEFTEAPTTEATTAAAGETTAAGETQAEAADPNGAVPSDEGYGVLREASVNKIGSLNPLTYINSYSSTQIKRSSMILYTYFPNEDYTFCELSGELAEEDPIQTDEEGKVWQIKIRDGVVWENGDDLDANDVYYTWRMILDPKLANLRASNFAKDVIEIENAMNYFEGKCSWEEVGLKLIDDNTVEIHTVSNHDAREIMTHLAHPANCIVNEEYYEKGMNADRTETLYGTSKDYWISSGPFLVDSWTNDAEINFVKNPNYVFKDKIWLAGINIKVVEDKSTQMQLFDNGEIDYVALNAETFLQYEEDPRVLFSPANSVRHMTFNTINPNQPILANEKFRQALFYATDRETISKMIKEDPADYIVPTTHIIDLANGVRFRDTEEGKANTHENFGYDPEKAKQLFEEALAEENIDKVSITMIYNDAAPQTVMSEFLQQSWQNVLGSDKFELKLQAMPSSQRSDLMRSWATKPDCYEISWGGWVSTDLMPWNAFKYWTTYYSAKNEPFLSEEFDEVFEAANFGEDRFEDGVRLKEVAQMEQMLIEPAIILPVTESLNKYLKSDRLELTMKNWANRVEWGWDYAKIVE